MEPLHRTCAHLTSGRRDQGQRALRGNRLPRATGQTLGLFIGEKQHRGMSLQLDMNDVAIKTATTGRPPRPP